MTDNVSPISAKHIAAVNAFDTNAIVSTCADDAFVTVRDGKIVSLIVIRNTPAAYEA